MATRYTLELTETESNLLQNALSWYYRERDCKASRHGAAIRRLLDSLKSDSITVTNLQDHAALQTTTAQITKWIPQHTMRSRTELLVKIADQIFRKTCGKYL